MEKFGLNQLRDMYLRFFESKGHLRLNSFSLIPQNDKSLLLINSGMAPLKPWFKGDQEPPRRRVTTCQKCIRTGDIENIGKTARHGTYFEMLGNFSFGDYFKREAIAFSWEFLTSPDWVGMDPDRLYPSIYEEDDEAFEIWNKEIGIPAERIVRLGKADNFWEHGSGPCGPCSEIYYDRGEEYGCGKPGCYPGCDCDRFMEIWNNVFSQFDNDGAGNYTELKQKNIDTGMGLERLAVVCQGVNSLFDVDTVMHVTNKVSEITGAHYGDSEKKDVSLRIITDHIRASTMMICDGVLPSNEGRGYVLRRLLRRAARHGKLLGVNKPFLFDVVETVVATNECAYPEVREKQAYITQVIRSEEENFAKTIDGGMKIFGELLESHKANGETVFAGADAFRLYDTYGFPIDLTREMVEEAGMTIDEEAFQNLMQEQRVRARKAREALGDLAWSGIDLGLDKTPTAFLGYEQTSCDAKILAVVTDGEVSGTIGQGKDGILVLDQTVMYAEMGGQSADHGVIKAGDACFVVTDVQKDKGGKYLHHGHMEQGELQTGTAVTAQLSADRRQAICRAHSATHLLHSALRAVLGEHVHQAGSLVEPDRLRFDFTHFSAMTAEEFAAVEALVNDWILAGQAIVTEEMTMDQAKEKGATALFDDKYGDSVRVVSMGDCSMELCGGTHLDNTAKVGLFKLTAESSVAAGVRRIEAVVGREILSAINGHIAKINEAAQVLKTTPKELLNRANQVINELKEDGRKIEQLNAKLANMQTVQLFQAAKDVKGVNVIAVKLEDAGMEMLRQMGDTVKEKAPNMVAVLSSVTGDKVNLLCVAGPEAVKKGAHAGKIIKEVATMCGGGGGGRPDSATAGGKDPSKLEGALEAVNNIVEALIK